MRKDIRTLHFADRLARAKNPMSRFYNTNKWKKFRAAYWRDPEHSWCVACAEAGKQTLAREIDHIIPAAKYKGSFYDSANLQPLCKSCHSRKTLKENRDAYAAKRKARSNGKKSN